MTEFGRKVGVIGLGACDRPTRMGDIRNGTDFLGMSEETRQKWMDAVRQDLALAVWFREGRPLSDNEVLRRLQKRYPDGIPQGTVTIEDVRSARERMSEWVKGRNGRAPLPITLHPEPDGRWCACSDGHHNGPTQFNSVIISYIEKVIHDSGYTVSTQLE
jgi:hypothetical protein